MSSYEIDDSCHNYKGENTAGDIQQVVNEVQGIAKDALAAGLPAAASFTEDESTNRLLISLFDTDPKDHDTVVDYFARISSFSPIEDFVVICDDQ